MAWMRCNFKSNVLNKTVNIEVIIPEPDIFYSREEMMSAGKFQTICLLHGASFNCSDWVRNTSIERYAAENQAAIVMPDMEYRPYNDKKDSWTYLTQECMQTAAAYFPLSTDREDCFLIGAGEGGYDAMKWGLAEPERFCQIAVISPCGSALDEMEELKKQYQYRGSIKPNVYTDGTGWEYCDKTLENILGDFPLKRNVYQNSDTMEGLK